MDNFPEYRVTIRDRTFVAVGSSRGMVVRAEGPLLRFVGQAVDQLTRACRQRGYPVSIHEVGLV
jgi:hypothetical protein